MRCLSLCLWLHRLLVITWQIYLLEKWLAKFLRVKICNKIKPTNGCGADRRRTREKMNLWCHSAIVKPNFHVWPCIFAAIFSFCLGFHLTVRFFLKNCFNPAQNPFGILVYQRFVEIMKFLKRVVARISFSSKLCAVSDNYSNVNDLMQRMLRIF